MPYRSLFIAFLLVVQSQLTGCAGYHVASAASWVTTGRSIPDWALTKTTGADCRLQHPLEAKYVCERPVVYNHWGID